MKLFYLSDRYNPDAKRPTDAVEAAIDFTLEIIKDLKLVYDDMEDRYIFEVTKKV